MALTCNDESVFQSSGEFAGFFTAAALVCTFGRSRATIVLNVFPEEINQGAAEYAGCKCRKGPEDSEDRAEKAQRNKNTVGAGLGG